jgi:pimeloyl-ACP methyl ester carboxylesterase
VTEPSAADLGTALRVEPGNSETTVLTKGLSSRLRIAERSDGLLEPDRRGVVRGLSPAGFHKIAYVDWGRIDDVRPVVCVHGLTRQGRDFDYVAARLVASGRRVVCPDLPGRGLSDRLVNPDDYSLPQYCSDMNVLIASLKVEAVDWIGTSLGGLIGMVLAGFPGNIVKRLVINDIGPFVSSTGLRRIGEYIQEMPAAFPTLQEAEKYLRKVLQPYGHLSEDHWAHLARHSVLWDEERGHFRVLCDSLIAKSFKYPWFYPLDLWKYWDAIEVPTLVLHGAKSDLLSAELAFDMRKRNRNADVFRFDDCGHVPPLMTKEQVAIVAAFIEAGSA